MKCSKCWRVATHQVYVLVEQPKAKTEEVDEWRRAFLERRGFYPTRREMLRRFGAEEVEHTNPFCPGHVGGPGIPYGGHWRIIKRKTTKLEEG